MKKDFTANTNMTTASAFSAEASCSCAQTMNTIMIIADAIILASVSVFLRLSLIAEVLILKIRPKSINLRTARA